jgi:hypothetical protein
MSQKIAEELIQCMRQRSMGRRRKGCSPNYDNQVDEALWRIRKVSAQPCGKRLKTLRPKCLPH